MLKTSYPDLFFFLNFIFEELTNYWSSKEISKDKTDCIEQDVTKIKET